MSRPSVSVVMPFAGDLADARRAAEALLALATAPGDELILADNSGTATALPGVTVVRALAERSPAAARNAGAAVARNDWILFVDADCSAPPDLLDAYFVDAVPDDVGAMAGEVLAGSASQTLAGRYGSARGFLSQQAHLEHPFRPRAVAANLMVRRAAFAEVGGFFEGVRAAEDTDFSWRLQEAGWRLELRPRAWVEHRYRTSLRELRRQWRGYAAGRAWLARRYEGFVPEPAVWRAARRVGRRVTRAPGAPARRGAPVATVGRLERGSYLAIDALLSAEELAGLALSNRPARLRTRAHSSVVIVADHFPVQGDPLVELARTLDAARVEALARPDRPDADVARELQIDYLEDDGFAARLAAFAALLIRHPARSALDAVRRAPADPGLAALAPAARRLERDRGARVLALGSGAARAVAGRLAHLAGRPLEEPARLPGTLARYTRRR